MTPSRLPDYAADLESAAWVAVELGKKLGASPDSPLVARIYEDVRRIEEAALRSESNESKTGL